MVEKKGFGPPRSSKEISLYKKEMITRLSQGMTKQTINSYMQSSYGIDPRTLRRYWSTVFNEYLEELKPEVSQELNTIVLQAKKRMEECAKNYYESKDPDWMEKWRKEAEFQIDFLKSVGILKPDVNVNVFNLDSPSMEVKRDPFYLIIDAHVKLLEEKVSGSKKIVGVNSESP